MENQETEVFEVLAVTSGGEVKTTAITAPPVVMTKEFADALKQKADRLKEGKMERGLCVNPSYYEFEKVGDSIQGVFIGFRTIFKKDDKTGLQKRLDCVVWADENMNLFMNAGVAFCAPFLEGQFVQGAEFGCEFYEKKKVADGYVKLFKTYNLFASE